MSGSNFRAGMQPHPLVFTRGAAFAIGLFILRRRGMLRFGRVRWARVAAITRVGLPTAATGIIFSVIYIARTRTITRFGTPSGASIFAELKSTLERR